MKRQCLFLSCVLGVLSAVSAAPLGLVLSGGGAKGAYEIGVWKAICERGLDKDLVAISGTSVGAINGVLFSTVHDPNVCEQRWCEVSVKTFSPNKEKIVDQAKRAALFEVKLRVRQRSERKNLIKQLGHPPTEEETQEIEAELKRRAARERISAFGHSATLEITKDIRGEEGSVGYLNSGRFRQELLSALPTPCWRKDSPRVYATALEKDSGRARVFPLLGLGKEDVVTRIMASAALPGVFDSVSVDGVQLIDGASPKEGKDNTPLRPILDNHPDVKHVIVVLLSDVGTLGTRIEQAEKLGVKLTLIKPSRDIGGKLGGVQGLFNTSEKQRNELLKLGYDDAMNVLVQE